MYYDYTHFVNEDTKVYRGYSCAQEHRTNMVSDSNSTPGFPNARAIIP